MFLESDPVRRPAKDLTADLDELSRALEEATQQNTELYEQLGATRKDRISLRETEEDVLRMAAASEDVTRLRGELQEEERAKRMWRMSCEQVTMHDELLNERDTEIARLQEQL